MKTRLVIFFSALLAFQIFSPSSVQAAPGAVDTTFNPSVNGTVYAMIAQPDGKILIGGSFTQINGIFREGVARLYPDGSLDLSYTNFLAGTIYAMVKQSDGKLLIGGSFSSVNSQTRYDIARLNVDGSLDGTFSTSNNISGTVYSLCVQSDGKIVFGGAITYNPLITGGTGIRYTVVRVNSDGSNDTNFNSGFNSSGGTVYAIAQQADGKLLIGGSFSSFGTYGVTRNNVARLGTDGTPDVTFPSVPTAGNGLVRSITIQSDGKSLWAGDFTSLLNSSRGRVGRLNADGSLDGSSFTGNGATGSIYATAYDTNANIYVGGNFIQYNNLYRGDVARLFSDGTADSTYTSVTNLNQAATIRCMAVQPDGRVLIGGIINSFNGVPRTNLVRLYADLYPAEIVTQPKSRNVVVGSNVTFTVDISNPTAASYQWRKDGVNLPGATFAQFSVFNSQFTDGGNYSVSVTTGAGGVTSSNALLQVGIAPAITQQPTSITVTQGQTASFTVVATGSPLNYIWSRNGVKLTSSNPSYTNSTLTISNCALANAGAYSVIVSNFLGTNFSATATLTVLAPVAILTQPSDQYSTIGGTATFSVVASGNPLNYQWLQGTNAIPGANSSSYTLSNIMATDATNYSVIVSNQFGAVTSSLANLIVGNPPVVTQQPVSQTVNEGASATLVCGVSGTAPISFQWLFNGSTLTNQTNVSLSLSNLTQANIGSYALTATNAFGGTISSNASINLIFGPFDINKGLVAWYPFNGNANDATTNGVNGTTTNGAVLVADRFGNTNSAYEFFGSQNITFTNLPLTQTDNWSICAWLTLDATSQLGMAVALGNNNNGGQNDGMELGISDGNFGLGQTVFGSLSGVTVNSGYAVAATNVWHHAAMVRSSGVTQIYIDGAPAGNTNQYSPLTPTSFTIGSSALSNYFQGKIDEVRIYNRALSSNDVNQLFLQEDGYPYITQQPQSLSVLAGQPASFSVAAVGLSPLQYQWFTNAGPSAGAISGATNATLLIASTALSDAGNYAVTVSNSYGFITSSTASLLVGQPPQTIQYRHGSNASFVISMPGTPGFNYVLQTTTNIVPPVVWTRMLTNVANSNGQWIYADTNAGTAPARFYRISGQ